MLVKYFEVLKETLKLYVEYKDGGHDVLSLVNTDYFLELYIIQFRFIQDSLRTFVDTLQRTTNESSQKTIDSKMIAFIVFVIVVVTAYLILWVPFVNKLNTEVNYYIHKCV